jgi:hypothetical protein
MNPLTFRLVLIAAYLTLALFGIGYNRLIDIASKYPTMRGSTSFAVVFGNAMTIIVMAAFFSSLDIPFWADMILLLGGFACSGAPMIIGHRMRYSQEQHDEEEARRNHRPLRWPKEMKVLRDSAAEEAMSGARSLGKLNQLSAEEDAQVSRARGSFVKIAALMSRAGALIRIEEL